MFDAFENRHNPKLPVLDPKKFINTSFECGKPITRVLDTETTVTLEYEDLIKGVNGSVNVGKLSHPFPIDAGVRLAAPILGVALCPTGAESGASEEARLIIIEETLCILEIKCT